MALSHDQCSAIVDACLAQTLSLMSSQDGWTEVVNSDEDGVQRHTRNLSDGRQMIRAVGTLEFPPEQIKEYIRNANNKKLWDEMLDEGFTVQEFDNSLKINYEHFALPWPVSHRDFVYAMKVYERPDGLLVVGRSVEFGVPEREGIVRGEIVASGFYLKRLGGRRTELTFMASVDMKGSLPGFVVDYVAKIQTNNVTKIREAMSMVAWGSN
jgi:hypothetical protein